MSTTHAISSNPFPLPHRAPGVLDELASRRSDDATELSDITRTERRRQRSFEGWVAGRIRKQSRHWPPRGRA